MTDQITEEMVEAAAKAWYFEEHTVMYDHEKLWKAYDKAWLYRECAKRSLTAALASRPSPKLHKYCWQSYEIEKQIESVASAGSTMRDKQGVLRTYYAGYNLSDVAAHLFSLQEIPSPDATAIREDKGKSKISDEPMTLLERLRNPQWVHSANSDAQLDTEQAVKDMKEAADEIERRGKPDRAVGLANTILAADRGVMQVHLYRDCEPENDIAPAPEGWRTMESAPITPCSVEFYYGNLPATWTDQHGNKNSLPAYRDDCERRELGYWDGAHWRYGGTGHRVFEFGDEDPVHLPTHWRPLLPPPPNSGDESSTPEPKP